MLLRVIAPFLLWIAAYGGLVGAAAAADTDAAVRGKYLLTAAGCSNCHSVKPGAADYLAGGRALPTPFGTFYTPNITPDNETGIGRWSKSDFERALRHGERPEGGYFFPSFPYPSYTAISDRDVDDIWAYLRSVPAISRQNRPHELKAPFGWRWLLWFWRLLYFNPGPLAAVPDKSPAWQRGRYIANALAHCGECHTPRGRLGGLQRDKWFAGALLAAAPGKRPSVVPNITPDKRYGIGKWSADDLETAFSMGMLPDGDFLGGEMASVAEDMAKLTPADRKDLITYLRSLPPISHDPKAP